MQMVSGEHTAASGPACKVDKGLQQLFRYHNNTLLSDKDKDKDKEKYKEKDKGKERGREKDKYKTILGHTVNLGLACKRVDKQKSCPCLSFIKFKFSSVGFWVLASASPELCFFFFFFSFSPLGVRSCMSPLMECRVTLKPWMAYSCHLYREQYQCQYQYRNQDQYQYKHCKSTSTKNQDQYDK